MAETLNPGVYIEEVPGNPRTVAGVSTSNTAFIDVFKQGPVDTATKVTSFAEFEQVFGGLDQQSEASYSIQQYFLNGGNVAFVVRVNVATAEAIIGDILAQTGMHALDGVAPEIFNLMCIPAAAKLDPRDFTKVILTAEEYCASNRAFLIIDAPPEIDSKAKMIGWIEANENLRHRNAAVYFSQLEIADPLNGNQPRNIATSGAVAGVYARVDETRGVFKAPANELLLGGMSLTAPVATAEGTALNSLGVNVLRNFPGKGNLVWGARTLDGADAQGSEWKYIPARRLALYLEESLYRGSQWAMFEPNDEPLWAVLRSSFNKFLNSLWRQGAFQGVKSEEAFFVKCDRTTMTQDDIDQGVVNVLVGFAPMKPAEFVLLRIQQIVGQNRT
jgi:uncharacterized protein